MACFLANCRPITCASLPALSAACVRACVPQGIALRWTCNMEAVPDNTYNATSPGFLLLPT